MKRLNKAVSEIVGTLLLLVISISLFSVIYLSVLTIYPSPTRPSVDLICSIDENNNNIKIEHCGGETLDLDTEFILTIAETNEKFTAGDYLNNESKNNRVWNIGERIVYPVGNITDMKGSISVVDIHSNSVILMVVFQGGEGVSN